MAAGMYDEWRFDSACLEGVELGARFRRAGLGVVLAPDLIVTSMKRWRLGTVCRDVWDRSRLLARSLGYRRMNAAAPSEVVIILTRTFAPAAALIAVTLLAAAFAPPTRIPLKLGVPLLAIVLADLPLHTFYMTTRGFRFAVLSAPMHLLLRLVTILALGTGWIMRYVFGDVSPDATTQAYSEVGLETWPPVPRKF